MPNKGSSRREHNISSQNTCTLPGTVTMMTTTPTTTASISSSSCRQDVTYSMVMNVSRSWDQLKLTPNYVKEAGRLIFTRLIQLEPRAAALFGFGPDTTKIAEHPKFGVLAATMVDMIDCAVAFLGPDLDPLEEQLRCLGKRHEKYGVQPDFFPVMGQAVLYALQDILGSRFTLEDTVNWSCVFQFMATKMALGMKE